MAQEAIRRVWRATATLSPVLIHFLKAQGKLHIKLQQVLAQLHSEKMQHLV